MDKFIKDIIKTILEEWEKLPPYEKDKLRKKLSNSFISFIGEGESKDNKKIIGIHLN